MSLSLKGPHDPISSPRSEPLSLTPDLSLTLDKETNRDMARVRPKGSPDTNCTAITKEGKPCRAPALLGDNKCASHSERPEVKRGMELARLRGALSVALGKMPAEFRRPDFSRHEGIRAMIEDVAAATAQGAMAPSVAQALASLANVALRATELGVELRLAELEEKVLKNKTKRAGGAKRVIPTEVVHV